MPNYASVLRRPDYDVIAPAPRPTASPIPRLARFLAEFHTSLNVRGLELFDGNIDRFLVFCLLLRTSLSQPGRDGAISVHSAALSLGRPFETVRRHISALTGAGICHRPAGGVTLAPAVWSHPDSTTHLRYAHDCFVRFVADSSASGVIAAPSIRALRPFTLEDGVCAAADLMLALIDGNRPLFRETTDLAIFSAIIHTTTQRFEEDVELTGADGRSFRPAHAVRIAQIARLLTLPDTTVRRRLAPMIGPHGPFTRLRTGLLIAPERLQCADTLTEATPRHGSIRLILQRAAASGFPFRHPATAYLNGRPDSPRVV